MGPPGEAMPVFEDEPAQQEALQSPVQAESPEQAAQIEEVDNSGTQHAPAGVCRVHAADDIMDECSMHTCNILRASHLQPPRVSFPADCTFMRAPWECTCLEPHRALPVLAGARRASGRRRSSIADLTGRLLMDDLDDGSAPLAAAPPNSPLDNSKSAGDPPTQPDPLILTHSAVGSLALQVHRHFSVPSLFLTTGVQQCLTM